MSKQVKIRKSLLLIISLILATAVAAVVTGVGLKHNAQLEFNDPVTGAIDYEYVFFVFSSWFVVSFLMVFIVGLFLNFVIDFFIKKQ